MCNRNTEKNLYSLTGVVAKLFIPTIVYNIILADAVSNIIDGLGSASLCSHLNISGSLMLLFQIILTSPS